MLSIRTVILSVVLVVLLLLAVSLVTAKTEAVPNPAGDPAAASGADLSHTDLLPARGAAD